MERKQSKEDKPLFLRQKKKEKVPSKASTDEKILKPFRYSNPGKFSHSDPRTNVYDQPFFEICRSDWL